MPVRLRESSRFKSSNRVKPAPSPVPRADMELETSTTKTMRLPVPRLPMKLMVPPAVPLLMPPVKLPMLLPMLRSALLVVISTWGMAMSLTPAAAMGMMEAAMGEVCGAAEATFFNDSASLTASAAL